MLEQFLQFSLFLIFP